MIQDFKKFLLDDFNVWLRLRIINLVGGGS